MNGDKELFFAMLGKSIFLEETEDSYIYTIVHSTPRLSKITLAKQEITVRFLGVFEIQKQPESLCQWSVDLPKSFLDSLYGEFGKELYLGFNAEDYVMFLRNAKNTHLRYLLREKKLSASVDNYVSVE